jgi:arylamine N-acetyltransferase
LIVNRPALEDALALAYLEFLGVDARPGEVDSAKLAELQGAHLAAVPYENIDIVRGDPPAIDPTTCVRRILGGRGGYCYHLNGGLSALLEWLGVDLTRHLAGVYGRSAPEAPGANGNHLGLTVRFADGEEWLVHAGLGDAPSQPVPLSAGTFEQHGYRFGLGPSPLAAGGWRFAHDPRGSWILFDIAREAATTNDFAAMHTKLSTSPDSGFVRVVAVMRRYGPRVELLRGCVFTDRETEADELHEHEIDTADDWWGLVIDGFGLAYGDLTPDARNDLWRRVRATHDAWDAAGRP